MWNISKEKDFDAELNEFIQSATTKMWVKDNVPFNKLYNFATSVIELYKKSNK